MCCLKLSEALKISEPEIIAGIDALQHKFEALNDTFHVLTWLYGHDFLYVSKSIEKILDHPFEKFFNHGMVFFLNITPTHLIDYILQTLNLQAIQIANKPDYIFTKEFLQVDAAIYNVEKEEIPVIYNALIMDVKTYTPNSYLMLCSWIDKRNKDSLEIETISSTIKKIFLEIKTLYIKSKPEYFSLLQSAKRISQREKEVAELLQKGHSTKSISEQLQITFHTVESHRKNILEKLSAKNTAELIHKLNSIPL